MPYPPIIDVSNLLDPTSSREAKLSTATEIDRACRDFGYFYISNHGISSRLTESMLENTKNFFENATKEDKYGIGLRTCNEGGDDARGYRKVDGDGKGCHEVVDFFRPVEEGKDGPPFKVGMGENQWPATPPSFRETAEEYVEAMMTIGTEVLRAIELVLGVEEGLMTSQVEKTFWNLRILGYDGREKGVGKNRVVGYREHQDFGIMTFSLIDSDSDSLQLLSKDGKWVTVDPKPGCFLCILGEMLSIWTAGIYESTRHRVIHSSDSMRISIPFFFDPNMDAYVSPLVPEIHSGVEAEGLFYWDKFVQMMKSQPKA